MQQLEELVWIFSFARRPALALAKHADEVRPASLDFCQADADHLALFTLLLGDAPALVHIHHINTPAPGL